MVLLYLEELLMGLRSQQILRFRADGNFYRWIPWILNLLDQREYHLMIDANMSTPYSGIVMRLGTYFCIVVVKIK